MIYNPFSAIPKNPKSHVRGWALHWSECLGAPIAEAKAPLDWPNLYIEHGVNFGGSLNLFGGVTEAIVDELEKLANYEGHLFSLDMTMPNYVEQLKKRVGKANTPKRLTTSFLDELDFRLSEADVLTQENLYMHHMAIGDSHATAFALKNSAVLRTNGLTLHGALQKGHFIQEIGRSAIKPKLVTLVCGSIDIRHHIGRQSDPERAVIELCNNYSSLVEYITDEFGIGVEVAIPVPVEFEERKIPKTGWYKGLPFVGSIQQRRYWTAMFTDRMSKHDLVLPPKEWYSMDGESYASIYMEPNSSVHIAPPFYRRNDWGQI